jgi:hypothetical protein
MLYEKKAQKHEYGALQYSKYQQCEKLHSRIELVADLRTLSRSSDHSPVWFEGFNFRTFVLISLTNDYFVCYSYLSLAQFLISSAQDGSMQHSIQAVENT